MALWLLGEGQLRLRSRITIAIPLPQHIHTLHVVFMLKGQHLVMTCVIHDSDQLLKIPPEPGKVRLRSFPGIHSK